MTKYLTFAFLVAALLAVPMTQPAQAGQNKLSVDFGGGLVSQSRHDTTTGNFTQPSAGATFHYRLNQKISLSASALAGSSSGRLVGESKLAHQESLGMSLTGSYKLTRNFDIVAGVGRTSDKVTHFTSYVGGKSFIERNFDAKISSWSPMAGVRYHAAPLRKLNIEITALGEPRLFQRESAIADERFRIVGGFRDRWYDESWKFAHNNKGWRASGRVMGWYSLASNVAVGLGVSGSYLRSDVGISRFQPHKQPYMLTRTDRRIGPVVSFRVTP